MHSARDRFARISPKFYWPLVLAGLVPIPALAQDRALDETAVLPAMMVMHWVLLTLSLVTVAGAVAGSHGWLWH